MATSRKKLYFSIMSIIITLVLGVGATYAWFTNINQQGFGFVIESDSLIFTNTEDDITDTVIQAMDSTLKETAKGPTEAYDPADAVDGAVHLASMQADTKVNKATLYVFNTTGAAVDIQISLALSTPASAATSWITDTNASDTAWANSIGEAIRVVITQVDLDDSTETVVADTNLDAIVSGTGVIDLLSPNDTDDKLEIAYDADKGDSEAVTALKIYIWLEGTLTLPEHVGMIGNELEGNIIFQEV